MTEDEKEKADEHQLPDFPEQRDDSPYASLHGGPPTGARQHVLNDAEPGRVGRPGGASQNSGGQLDANGEELGTGPGRGAD
jgi:hypothetical protein